MKNSQMNKLTSKQWNFRWCYLSFYMSRNQVFIFSYLNYSCCGNNRSRVKWEKVGF